MAITKTVKEKAFAKVNLGLDVLKRREDGYHEVKMVMQTIGICDELTFETSPEIKDITMTTDVEGLSCDDSNLVIRAAKMITEKYSVSQGVKIRLIKNIPLAAGMAGGSADAAATLRGINRLFGLGLTDEELCIMAVKLGADVPFCVYGGTFLAEGIGEKLTKLPDIPNCSVLIVKPHVGVSTKHVYESLHVETIEHHPDMDTIIDCAKRRDLGGLAFNIENILENVTVKEYPIIDEIKNKMMEHGAMNALMSGSGPTVFGLFDSKPNAERAAVTLRDFDEIGDVIVTCFEDMSADEVRKKARITIKSDMDENEVMDETHDCVAIEKRGNIIVTYYEKEPESNSDIINTLTISDRRLVYEKTGAVNTRMIITPEEATSQVYSTPHGDIDIDIICHEFVLNEIADRIVVELDYDLMQQNAKMSHCNMRIEVEYNI